MRTIRSLLTLSAILFMALAIAPTIGQPARAAQSVPAASAPCVNHLFGSGTVTGGKQITLRVRLGRPAGAGGVVVLLSSSSAAVSVPRKTIVPEGSRVTFYVASQPVAATESVTITASTDACSASKTVTVKAPVLRSLSVQSVMSSGGLGKITVCLTGRAAAPVDVALTSSDNSLIAAATITVPAGKGCVSYKTPVGEVVSATPVAVTVSQGGVTLNGSTTVKLFITSEAIAA